MTVRELTLKLLCDAEENGKYVNLSLNSHLLDGISDEERAFVTALLYTTVERKITLDYWIGTFTARSPDDLSGHTKNVLRLGLCQLAFFEKVPVYAAVNETVALAANAGERALVNAVLRRAAQAPSELPYPPREKNPARYLSIRYSFPLWMVKRFCASLGEEDCERMLAVMDEKAPLTVAVNPLKTARDAYIKTLSDAGIPAEPTPVSPVGIRISSPIPVKRLPGFTEGLFYVQDEASQIHALVLAPRPGETVADVCAAPGGKSIAAALAMENRGTVLSMDLHENKLSLLRDSAARLGITCLSVSARDALTPDPALSGKADRVICDVPCTGLGVMGKKPDLRYKEPESVGELAALGYDILSASVSYLKPGGVLVYSTCTLTAEENENNVDRFLREHPDFSPEPFSVGGRDFPDGRLTLYPHRDGTDGFFIAKLRKTV